MYWKQHNLEIIYCRDNGNGEHEVQVAVDGILALPMDIHKSVRELYPSDDEWLNYLTTSAETMIQIYGDARHPMPVDIKAYEAEASVA